MNGVVGLLVVAALIAANGLFVAAEFSLVSVRRPTVEERADRGDRRAKIVSRELSDVSFALSVAQFGITATSLLVGYLAEDALGDAVIRPFLALIGVPEQASLGIALTAAFALSTITQMVIGELFPKNLAIARPLGVALAVTPFTRGFGILFGPVIKLFDVAAQSVTRWVFHVEVADELEAGHDLDELARIIAVSGAEGSLTEDQTTLLRRAVELGDRRIGEVMVPRPDVSWLEADDTLAELRTAAARTGHSRFPVRDGSDDEVIGSVHVKDLIGVPGAEQAGVRVRDVASEMLIVPESASLRRLLTELRREHRTAALVIDEYGSTAGIVTLENVLEELVGEIEDEFDRDGHFVRRVGVGRHLVRGALRVDRAAEILGIELPDGEYETVAGFVLDQLGHIPEAGERFAYGEVEFTVNRVEGARITQITVRRTSTPSAPGGGR